MTLKIPPDMWLPAIALLFMGALGMLLLFVPIPVNNEKTLTFIVGAISGVMTTNFINRLIGAQLTPSTTPDDAK